MWVADTDFKAPQPVIDALKERAEHGLFGYSTSTLDTSFGEAAKKWMNKRFGLAIEEEWVTFTPSVVPALVVAIQAFSNVGDKIVIQSPAYHPFHSIIPNNGRVKVENELIYNVRQYKINFDELEQQLKNPRTSSDLNDGTFAAPGVGVEVNFQSVDALSVSIPSGKRASEPLAVLESATVEESAMPSTRLRVPEKPLIFAAVIAPS